MGNVFLDKLHFCQRAFHTILTNSLKEIIFVHANYQLAYYYMQINVCICTAILYV